MFSQFFKTIPEKVLTPKQEEKNNSCISTISCSRTHTLFLSNDGKIYGTGMSGCGELGRIPDNHTLSPIQIENNFSNKKINSITAGISRSYFVTEDGMVFICGYVKNKWIRNSSFKEYDTIYKPIPMYSIVSPASQVVESRLGTLFLMKDGTVHLYHDKNNQEMFTILSIPDNIKIISITAGGDFFLLISEEGDVYGYGNNYKGQLGFIAQVSITVPIKIHLDSKIKNIAAGSHHSLFLLENGRVKGCGSNRNGQLGFGKENLYIKKPRLIPNAENINDIAASSIQSFFQNNNNEVWICGANQFNQIRKPTSHFKKRNAFSHNCYELQKVNYLNDSQALFSGHSAENGFTRSITNEIKGFGGNKYGQLGIGKRTTCNPPKIIYFPEYQTSRSQKQPHHIVEININRFLPRG